MTLQQFLTSKKISAKNALSLEKLQMLFFMTRSRKVLLAFGSAVQKLQEPVSRYVRAPTTISHYQTNNQCSLCVAAILTAEQLKLT